MLKNQLVQFVRLSMDNETKTPVSSFQQEMVKLTINPKVHSVSFLTDQSPFLKKFACVIALYPVGKAKPVSFIGTDLILDRAFFLALDKYGQ